MTASLHPAAPHHLPPFITAPGETDVLMAVMAVFLVGAEEIVRLETIRDATLDENARRDADFALSRLEQVKATLSF